MGGIEQTRGHGDAVSRGGDWAHGRGGEAIPDRRAPKSIQPLAMTNH